MRETFLPTPDGLSSQATSGLGPNLHLIERLTRIDPDTLLYEYTVNDPTIWTKPWTAVIPMKQTSEQIYEYGCHEENFAIRNVLRGARSEEDRSGR